MLWKKVTNTEGCLFGRFVSEMSEEILNGSMVCSRVQCRLVHRDVCTSRQDVCVSFVKLVDILSLLVFVVVVVVVVGVCCGAAPHTVT